MVSKSVLLKVYQVVDVVGVGGLCVWGGVGWDYLQPNAKPDRWLESCVLLVKWPGSMATLLASQHVKCERGGRATVALRVSLLVLRARH